MAKHNGIRIALLSLYALVFARWPHGLLCRFPVARFRSPSLLSASLAIVRLYTLDRSTAYTYSVVLSRIIPFIASYRIAPCCPVKGLGGGIPVKGFCRNPSVCRVYDMCVCQSPLRGGVSPPDAACRSVLVMYISYHGRQAARKGFFAF